MKTDTKTLIEALRVLSKDIQSDDGIANACIAEAADRLEELTTHDLTPEAIEAGAIALNAFRNILGRESEIFDELSDVEKETYRHEALITICAARKSDLVLGIVEAGRKKLSMALGEAL